MYCKNKKTLKEEHPLRVDIDNQKNSDYLA